MRIEAARAIRDHARMKRIGIAAVVCAAAACGKSGGARGGIDGDPDAVVAAAMKQPVIAFHAADVARVDEAEIPPGTTYAALVERATKALGRPTLEDPRHAKQRELTWAAVEGPSCTEVRVYADRDGVHAVGETTSSGTSFWACADASRGSAIGRSFDLATMYIDTLKPDAVERELGHLGDHPAHAEEGGRARWVWASTDPRRCWYAIATVEGEHVAGQIGVAIPGDPRYAACGDWASGKPTGVWAPELSAAK
jgi:hypothetical protein